MLEIKNISKSYNTQAGPRKVLQAVNISVASGDIAAVMGPSGSGKTTLLNIAGLLDAPDSGEVQVFGMDAGKLSAAEVMDVRNEKIGFVFQHHFLIPELDVWRNVSYPATVRGGGFTAAMKEQAFDLLDYLKLEKVRESYPESLSGGESQRVAIARAVFNSPEILIMDEPTGSLDYSTKLEVLNLIKKLNEISGITFLIATHDEAVRGVCKKIFTLPRL